MEDLVWIVDLVDLEWDYTEPLPVLQHRLEQTEECQDQEPLDFQALHSLDHLLGHLTHLEGVVHPN